LDDDEDEEGGEEYEKLIDLFTAEISKLNNYITVRKFTSDSKDRNAMLEDFASGKLQVLTSMKCLDEGIDVPRSEMAIFCASTGNERQFVQRRGRILRKHPDKKYAIIHDLVVIPKVSPQSPSYKMEQSLLIGELKRVNNFALLSENPSCAQLELNDVMDYYGLNLFNNNHIS
jgi:superfamily II DNA or RNA helicase